jgi:uncharacterized membrane protein
VAQVGDGAETAASTERLMLFSDAVIAIAITLLVLDIKLPELPQPISNAALATALLSIEPKLTAYIVSFLVVGLFWYGHLLRFRFIRRSDGRLICLNLLFLMTIGFVPFASAVLSDAKNAVAYVLYDGTMMLVALLATAIWCYAAQGDRLIDPGLDPRIRRHLLVAPLTVAGVFVVSGLAAQIDVRLGRLAWLLIVPAALARPRRRPHPRE